MNIFKLRVTFEIPVIDLRWQEQGLSRAGWATYQTYWWLAPLVFIKYWNQALRSVTRRSKLKEEQRWPN